MSVVSQGAGGFASLRTASIVLALSLCCGSALALKPANVTDGELALTPPYCPDTMGFKYGDAYSNTSPRAAGWVAQLGKGFWAMHHYCWALINLRRTLAVAGKPELRKGNLLGVLGDYMYVIDNVPPNFILLPEIYTKIGEVHVHLGDFTSAFDAYKMARNLKPDYWPAYTQWADVLTKAGQKEEAKRMLRLGLQHSPGTQPLMQRYLALGGKPDDIVPLAMPSVQEPAVGASEPAPSQ